jgi:PHD/YefM family antitoxin component YafN of YafNO toxin-antitoxin module
MATATIGISEAKSTFSQLTKDINRTGVPVTVFKNNKPWVIIQPASTDKFAEDAPSTLPKETIEALQEVEYMKKNPNEFKSYSSAEELFANLGI